MLADAYESRARCSGSDVHVPDVRRSRRHHSGARRERINIEDFELQHLSGERGGR